MLSTRMEIAAALLVLATLAGIPAWVVMTESASAVVRGTDNPHVITLTAVAEGGIWTEEDVIGHSYWRRMPKPARLVVRVGETAVIRLKSADVTHSFAIPDLGVDPVVVEPGHVSEVRFVPTEPGQYLIQCSLRCGACHEEMRTTIVVLGPGQTLEDYPADFLPPRTKCPHHSGKQT